MHGDALTNLLFVPSGSTIIEITGDFMERKQDWYSKKIQMNLTSILDQCIMF